MLDKIITILKNWTLPISMIAGAAAYFIGTWLPIPSETKTDVLHFVEWIQPILLFTMLFVAFCKVKPSELKPRIWHLWLLLIQCVSFAAITFVLWRFPNSTYRLMFEGLMLVILCPTATACAVVTQKLGGNSAATTSYTILINLSIAILAPILLPIAHPNENISFIPAFLIIIKKVFPLLMLPLLLAWAVRFWSPKLHNTILKTKDLAFYLWAVSLAIAIAVTCRALANSTESLIHVGEIAIATLIACIFQFAVGKKIGDRYGMKTEGGQALGQKNTVFIIWLGYTFLSPITAVAGGFYSVWHNVINSWQLYQHRLNAKQ